MRDESATTMLQTTVVAYEDMCRQNEAACRRALRWETLARDLAYEHLGMSSEQWDEIVREYITRESGES